MVRSAIGVWLGIGLGVGVNAGKVLVGLGERLGVNRGVAKGEEDALMMGDVEMTPDGPMRCMPAKNQ